MWLQCDQRKPYNNTIKRIGRYLRDTKGKGLTFKSTCDLSEFECYGDADYTCSYIKETCEDPNYVKSRTEFVIKYAGYPITWLNRLQSEITLSTTKADYISLSTSSQEVLPRKN